MQVMGRLNKTALYFDTATFLTGKCQLVVENSNNVIIDIWARGGEGDCWGGGGGGGGGPPPPPPPPQILGNSDFLGSKRKFGQSQFLKMPPCLFNYFEDLNINLKLAAIIVQLHSHETVVA